MKKTMKRLWLAAVLTLCAGATASAYDLTVAESEHGTVGFSVGGTAVTTAEAGQVVTISIKPAADYAVDVVKAQAYTSWGTAQSRRAPGLVKDITLTGSGTEWTFMMPEANVEVSTLYKQTTLHYDVDAEDTESGKDVDGVTLTMTITDEEAKNVTIEHIVVPTSQSDEALTVHIPAMVAGYEVTGIAAGAVPADCNVTDIYLPETEQPINIEQDALPATTNIHTPLALLDDYALMLSLKDNFETLKVMTTVTPKNTHWTLSCGVDVVLPDELKLYMVYTDGQAIRMTVIDSDQLVLAQGRHGIKANNGVLIIGQSGRSYDLVACPGRQQSGTVPATTDAKSYGEKNQLEPVIVRKNYAAGQYYVLKDNQFHSIKGNTSRVKACRAVLRVK